MSEEELIDYIMDLDRILAEAESGFDTKQYKKAFDKLKEARQLIDDLRQEDCADDTTHVEMNLMNKLK